MLFARFCPRPFFGPARSTCPSRPSRPSQAHPADPCLAAPIAQTKRQSKQLLLLMTSMTRPTRKKKKKEEEEEDDADKEQSSSSAAAAAAAAAAQGKASAAPDGTATTSSTSTSSIVRIDPPSHILQNGTLVHLPPFTDAERSAFFARSVARYGLVSAASAGGGGGDGDDGGDEEDVARDAAAKGEVDTTTAESATKKGEDKDAKKGSKGKHKGKDEEEEDTTAPKIHPLALASAKLNHVGISEMSKSINLTGLVANGEYVGLTNVVSSEAERAAAVAVGSEGGGGVGVGVGGGATSGTAVQRGDDDDDEEQHQDLTTHDKTNRSTYTLTHHAHSLQCASHILNRHYNRLLLGTTAQSIIDTRLFDLRKRWRLVAPEHGMRTSGAVRPNEVIAVDVEVYDRDRVGGGVGSGSSGAGSSHGGGASGKSKRKMGRIAKRVPRYATIELRDGYGLRGDAEERLAKRKKLVEAQEKKRKEEGGGDKDDDVKMEDVKDDGDKKAPDADIIKIKTEEKDDDDTQSATSNATDDKNNKEKKPRTIAEPYAVADPTLGKVDLDFDPDQVPLLTLSMSIEKTRTGYVEEVVLSSVSGSSMGSGSSSSNSSSSSSATNDDADPQEKEQQQQAKPADEPVIYALQHSLFCASLFESMRGELISAESGSSPGAWLAGGTDETFLPAPTRMDGAPPAGGGPGGTICVVHCHQGEVKVRLDSEYDLTVKLVEAGTVSSSSSGGAGGNKNKNKNKDNNDAAKEEEMDSGSQSPAYLRALCRALLLHAQSSYHDHRLRMHEKAAAMAAAERAKAASGIPPGLARRKKEAEEERPLILGGVLALGGKMLLERTVRESLRKLSRHIDQRSDITDRLVVDWLTLSMFDSTSYFTASVGPTFTIDVCIDAGGMTVTSFGDEGGEYRSVRYGSAEHFEMYMQFQLMRLARSGNGDSGRRNGGSRQ